ncbi:MAG: STN domain-containing protein, partial [Daejeonella sp.]
MKFYTQFKCWGQARTSLKFLLVMKLTIIFLITAFLQVSLAGYGQKITLSEKNASIEQLFRQIRSQTGYNILCDADLIKEAKPVDIQVKNTSIEEALEKCFAGQPLTYTI